MSTSSFTLITPAQVYNGLVENPTDAPKRLSDLIRKNKVSENSYMDWFANTVRIYGKREAAVYAKMMGANYRHFDGAIRCLAGISAHRWITEYLRMVACDLVEHTDFNFKTIGKILGFSQSSFSQFFRAYQGMQAWEYRNLKRHGKKEGFFF